MPQRLFLVQQTGLRIDSVYPWQHNVLKRIKCIMLIKVLSRRWSASGICRSLLRCQDDTTWRNTIYTGKTWTYHTSLAVFCFLFKSEYQRPVGIVYFWSCLHITVSLLLPERRLTRTKWNASLSVSSGFSVGFISLINASRVKCQTWMVHKAELLFNLPGKTFSLPRFYSFGYTGAYLGAARCQCKDLCGDNKASC